MLVTRVVSPVSSRESWTVLGDDDRPVEPVERYLGYLSGIERSPNTIKAYAHDLKDWFEYLADRELDWWSVTLEDIGGFVAWLRAPVEARAGRVAVLPSVASACSASTVNRKLSALGSFYTHAARDGVDVAQLLSSWQVGGARGGWKPFLHHIGKSMPQQRRVVSLKAPKKLPRILSPEQVQALLDGCEHLRDRLLLAVLYDTGMRIGEALGLRHNDIAAAERQITVVLRLEMQYVLQRRSDRRDGRLAPAAVTRVIRLLAASEAVSILDHDEDTWLGFAAGVVNDSRGRALLLYTRRAIADLVEGSGWEAEYPRDVWRMHRLGYPGRHTLQFDRIDQSWLRQLAKRWIRLRLSSGFGLEAGGFRPLVVIIRFSQFLTAAAADHIDRIDRELLERYLADLTGAPHPQRRSVHIDLLNTFFTAVRQHRWHTELPPTAMFFPADHPRRTESMPKALSEHVMSQLEQPANLDRLGNPDYRLITVVLMQTGLRVTDALRLRQLRHHRPRGRTLPALLQPQVPAPDRWGEVIALKGDSYRLKDRDLGRVPPAGTTED